MVSTMTHLRFNNLILHSLKFSKMALQSKKHYHCAIRDIQKLCNELDGMKSIAGEINNDKNKESFLNMKILEMITISYI